jgi:hypothetical protein
MKDLNVGDHVVIDAGKMNDKLMATEVRFGVAPQAPSKPRTSERLPSSSPLTADDLRELDVATAKISVQGARYQEELERMTYR